jgi:hypothetical protein
MSKNAVIISIIAVLVIAGGVVGGLYLFKYKPGDAAYDPTGPAKAGTVLVADTSKDFNATTLLSKDAVKSALGAVAVNLEGPNNLGIVNAGEGGESQTAVYPFISGGTIDNSYNVTNAFSLEVFQHKDKASVDSLISVKQDTAVDVTGLGDSAWFIDNNTAGTPTTSYSLIVVSGTKHYTFKISQPAEETTFTLESAKTALTTIASELTY